MNQIQDSTTNKEEGSEVKTKPSAQKRRKNKYKTQNIKIWTINFSSDKNVARAKVIIQALMTKAGIWSKGVTVLLAVEYCMQERIVMDFLAYANSRRRALIGDGRHGKKRATNNTSRK